MRIFVKITTHNKSTNTTSIGINDWKSLEQVRKMSGKSKKRKVKPQYVHFCKAWYILPLTAKLYSYHATAMKFIG